MIGGSEATNASLVAALIGLPHGIPALIADRGRVVAANAAARALFGDAAAPGALLEALFLPASREKLAGALTTSVPGLFELQARPGDRDPVALRMVIVPMPGGQHLLFSAGIGVEYTERIGRELMAVNDRLTNLTRDLSRRAHELELARARLEELAGVRDQFIATLAHDVRGPLHSIGLRAGALRRRGDAVSPAEVIDATDRIERTVARIDALTQKVLESARMDTSTPRIDPRPISFARVAEEVVETLTPVAEEAGVRLVCRSGTQALVPADAVRLAQILGNLIDNAIRHSPREGRVEVEVTERDGFVRCAVRDEGPGIAPEMRARVFERFVQEGQRPGAAGLGLSIARRLVELHRGRIWIDAEAPGTVFLVELPRADGPPLA